MAKYFLLLNLLFVVATNSYSQTKENLLASAKKYYDEDQYREALNLLNKYIEKDSLNAEVYKLRGNCFMEFNQNESALEDYRMSAKVDTTFTDAYFNLANAFELLEKIDSAEHYFRVYISKVPEDPDGYVRLGLDLQMQGREDSVLSLFEYAYELDTNNVSTIYILAQEYFYREDFKRAIKYSEKGNTIDSLNQEFYILNSMAEFNSLNFEKAKQKADIVLRLDSLNFDAYVLSLESEMMIKTNRDAFVLDEYYDFKFVNFTSPKIQEILSSDSLAVYTDLKSKINEGEILSLEDYFRFYISQRKADDYSPYFTSANAQIAEYYNNEQFEELTSFSDAVLQTNPLRLGDIYRVAVGNYMMRKMDNFKRLYAAYFGTIESIVSTGTGENYDSAYIVMSTADEYVVLSYSGMQSNQQALTAKDGHSFDVLTAVDDYGDEHKVYFNIDVPFSSLSSQFSPDSSKKKGKKKKKKKDKK
ncbi:MAG: hypothetical protein CMO01_28640 [Thalassobius sp.]|nr:hypothetical protein [Thalassovita sp.]